MHSTHAHVICVLPLVLLLHRFPDLTPLVSTDSETDFFLNAAHLQLHRRARALHRLGKLADGLAAASTSTAAGGAGSTAAAATGTHQAVASGVSVSATTGATAGSLRVLLDIAVPLLQVVIAEGGEGVGADGLNAAGHERDAADIDRAAALVDAACGALRSVARALPWNQYDALLAHLMRAMQGKPSKPNIRAVCVVLDAFHFPLPHNLVRPEHAGQSLEVTRAAEAVTVPAVAQAGNTAAAAAAAGQLPAAEIGADAAPGEGQEEEEEVGEEVEVQVAVQPAVQVDPAVQAEAVQRALLRRVLPVLHRQLVQKGEAPVARAPVALALVKLLRLLPADVERTELPRALQGVCNLLTDRQQRVRDDARAVLVSVAKELGPAYMPYIVNVLRATLPDRGFTAHVIGYTLHAVLEAVVGHLIRRRAKGGSSGAAVVTAATAGGDVEMGDDGKDQGATAEGDTAGGAGEEEGEEEWRAVTPGDAGQTGGQAGSSASNPEPEGLLDEAMALALPLLEAEVFGEVAEAKEVAQFANNYKEAKKVSGWSHSHHVRYSTTVNTVLVDTLQSLCEGL